MKATEIQRDVCNAELNEKLTDLESRAFQPALSARHQPAGQPHADERCQKRHRPHQDGAARVGNEKRAVNEGRI